MEKIVFRKLKIEDLPLLCKWLNKPHVRQWYNHNDEVTLDKIKQKMLPRIQGKEAVFCYLILLDEKSVGYIQWYDARNFPREDYNLEELESDLKHFSKLAALDIYIGEKTLVGKGVGSAVINQFIQEVIAKAGYEAYYVDPETTNLLSINAFKKVGFTPLRKIKSHNDKLLQAMIKQNGIKINHLIIALGSPNTETGQLLPIAISRLTKAIEIYKQHPQSKILLTGGFGEHFNKTTTPHAEYARQYLLQQGMKPEAILEEIVLSTNTIEDAVKALPLIRDYNPSELVVISSDFHIQRVKFIFDQVLLSEKIKYISAETHLSREELNKLIMHEKNALNKIKNLTKNEFNELIKG